MATRVPRRLRDQQDVDATAIADGKVPVYRSASDKHEYETPAGGGVSDHGALTGLADNDHPQYALAAGVATDAELAAAVSASEAGQVRDGDAAGGVLSGTYPNPGFAADLATQAELDAHVNDAADAHDASAISFVPTGTIAATDVQAAIAEAASEAGDLANAVILAPAASSRNVIQPTLGSVIAAVLKAHATQSVDLTQWQKSDQTVLARILSTGAFEVSPVDRGVVTIGAGTFEVGEISLEAAFVDYPDVPGASMFVPIRSYSDDNAITTGDYYEVLGKTDFTVEVFNTGTAGDEWRQTTATVVRRRISDKKIIAVGLFNPTGYRVARYDPDTDAESDFANIGVPHGIQLSGAGLQEAINVHNDISQTQPLLLFVKQASVWKWGIFGAAAVAQQSASSVGALWTALKAYGWLDAGSSAPSLATSADLSAHEADTTSVHGITDTSTLYLAGGTDVALADGGTGASLTDPNADRIMFWDDSAGAMTWLTPGTNLTVTGTTIDAAGGGGGGAPTDAQYIVGAANGTLTDEIVASAFALTLLDDADAATARATLGAGTSSVTALDALSDAAVSSPAAGQILEYDGSNFVNVVRAYGLLPTAALAETFPRTTPMNAQNLLATSRVNLVAIDLPKGLLITSIVFVSGSTAATVPLNQVFGLYDSSRALLRSTADDTTTAWAADTAKTLNLTSTFTTTYRGLHYLAILVVATTVPALMGQTGSRGTAYGLAPILWGISTTAVTALPATAAAITVQSQGPFAYVK